METAGVLLGLGAAFALSFSYIFTRLYVIRREKAVIRLLVLAHVIMGAASLLLLPLIWTARVPPLGQFILPLSGAVGFYMLGQVGLFYVLRDTDASRVSPLLGLKIVMLAVITAAFLGKTLSGLQWAAVGLSVSAAFLLNSLGGALPLRALIGIVLTCLTYSLSDLSIRYLVDALADLGWLRASVLGVCMSYVLCGAIGLALLPWAGRNVLADWPYAAAFAAAWLISMMFLYACFALVGVVFGNILQSTRGLISIVIGARLAGLGMVHLERRHPRHVVLRRLGAAALMCLAIGLYLSGS